MPKSSMNPKVDAFIRKAKTWQPELQKLRTILLDCQLTEELKWGKPGYTFQDHNVIVILPVKAYCALLFLKGALLKDSQGLLVKAGPNTEAGRQARFTSVPEITEKETALRACIRDAIEVEKAGLKVAMKKPAELVIPAELKNKWKQQPALETAFKALTPGRQRSYIFYFSGAKQSTTREARIEKCVPLILKGKGLND